MSRTASLSGYHPETRGKQWQIKVISTFLSVLVVATVIGYPLVGIISAAIGLPSVALSYPFRIVVALIALVQVGMATRLPDKVGVDGPVLIFWFLYLVRFGWDIMIANVPGADAAFFYFGILILVPCTSIMISAWAVNETQLVRFFFITGQSICFFVVMMNLFGIGLSTSLTEETGRLSFEAVNPITLGHVGTSTILAGIAILNRRSSAAAWVSVAPGIIFAFICLILAASRGPMVALVAGLIFFAFARRHYVFVIFGLGAFVAYIIAQAASGNPIEIYARFSNISEDESALERLLIQANAVDQFLTSPWLGSAYIERVTGFIPHNMLIESAMALGVGGAILFTLLAIRGLRRSLMLAKTGSVLLPMLFIQSLANSQLSGSLWQSADFWAMSILLTIMPHNSGRK